MPKISTHFVRALFYHIGISKAKFRFPAVFLRKQSAGDKIGTNSDVTPVLALRSKATGPAEGPCGKGEIVHERISECLSRNVLETYRFLYYKLFSSLNRLSSPQIFFILFFLGLIIYANVVFYPFVHDERIFILQNPSIGDLNIKDIFLNPPVASKDFSLVNTYYRPFLELLNRLLYKVFYFNSSGYHLVNILLHILNSFLVYQITQILGGRQKILSLILTVIFLIHPIQSEAVACISGISNLLFTSFGLFSFLFYLWFLRKKFLSLYALSLLLFWAALFVKEQAVILPFLILLYEFCFSSAFPSSRVRLLKQTAGFFIILAGYFWIRTSLIGFPITHMASADPEFWLRVRSIPGSLLMYLGLIFFPHHLHYYRRVDMLQPFILPTVSFLIILIGAGYLISLVKQERRLLIFGIGWFFLSQMPTLNIIPIVNEYSFLLAAEHFMYFPLVGILLFTGGAGLYFISLWQGNDHRLKSVAFSNGVNTLGGIVLFLISLIFMAATIKQNTYWRADIPLFERTLRFEKNFGRGHLLLAQAYTAHGEWEKALGEYKEALLIMQGYIEKIKNEKVRPFYEGYIKDIYAGIGYCYLQTEQFSKALFYFEKLFQEDSASPVLKNSLAICYLELGDFDKGEQLLKDIVKEHPAFVPARQNLERLLPR